MDYEENKEEQTNGQQTGPSVHSQALSELTGKSAEDLKSGKQEEILLDPQKQAELEKKGILVVPAGEADSSRMSQEEKDEMIRKAQLEALLKQNRTSNLILLVLIAIYVLSLFFFNNWLVVILLIIPMVGLVIWDNRRLKKIRQLQKEIQKDLDGPAMQEAISSLNELSKEYTVLDHVDLDGTLLEHVILSPYGVVEVSSEDESEKLREDLDLSEDVPVLWVSSSESVLEQQRRILSLREPVLDEQQIFAILYKLSGIRK